MPEVTAAERPAIAAAERPAIAAAVVVQDGRLLLVQRRVSEGSLSWQLPAGAVEPGETFAAAAVRETAEETGLVVAAVTTLGERVHPDTGRIIGYVACRVQDGEAYVADTDEVRDIAWVTPAELRGYVPRGFATVVQDYLVAALV
ncbi:NUDIX hydrolase [Promicromonospora sp. CA-289599]|uniref:NUDIX hydrolase n=1 Tax=Promicromonospora sp. CA-289599 TaxID=3240014 RepID=UPI003D92263C